MPTESIDLAQVARELHLSFPGVQRTAELLEDGNTVAFIARFRKDQTGGLNEEDIRRIEEMVRRQRALAERKQTIIKSIESQGKLTAELAAAIAHAHSSKVLEDLYLPFRPRKQSLAIQARQRGLEPFAHEILIATPSPDPATPPADLKQLATTFGSTLPQPMTGDDVLLGVGHLLADQFNEHVELKTQLRRIMQRTGKLISTRIEAPQPERHTATEKTSVQLRDAPTPPIAEVAPEAHPNPAAADSPTEPHPASAEPDLSATESPSSEHPVSEHSANESPANESPVSESPVDDADVESSLEEAISSEAGGDESGGDESGSDETDADATGADESGVGTVDSEDLGAAATEAVEAPSGGAATGGAATGGAVPVESSVAPLASVMAQRSQAAQRKAKQREKKRKLLEAAFKDYFQFTETLGRMAPHRVLAINRGERAKILRIKIESDLDAMEKASDELLIPPDHPYADFLRGCLCDSLSRLILPGLERETRRELTERAEERAIDVFVRNLRHLLLQQPVRGRRVLAIDPGFRSGCKMVALDEFGNVLGHGVMHIVGKDEWRAQGKAHLVHLVRHHHLSVVAIGNGAGCRGTEQVVSEVISHELQGHDVTYVIVNEAGTNEYSTSTIGREELPDYDPTLRSAISIGRRLLDPLSELVKINPANIGVGLYQHDMKLKHLRESLDAVVKSCVNYVGVDINTASPELLTHVSGLHQLTARRLYDFRREHGPFRNREQLKQVPGFGEASFVQAAGFLRITDGDNPLDTTWIHPESYAIALRVLERLGCSVDDLRRPKKSPAAPQPAALEPAAPEASDAAAATELPVTTELPVATGVSPAADAAGSGSVPAESLAPVPPIQDAVAPEPSPEAASASLPAASEVSPEASELSPVHEPVAEPVPEPIPEGAKRLAEAIGQVDVAALSSELGVGTMLLEDILSALQQPGRDPREDLPAPIFRRGIIKLEDLQPGMEIVGTVLNVVDFGAFVDIGISDSGLVHISRLADRFVRDPHDVVGVGDVLKVWVVEVDKGRRRVSLTAIKPGTERPAQKRPESPRPHARGGRPEGRQTNAPAQGQTQGSRPQGQSGSGPRPPMSGGRSSPPRTDGGQQEFKRRGKGGRPPKFEMPKQPPKKPKPVVPLTKEMEEGKEPLRSFSDLLQFYELNKKKPEEGNS